MNMRGSVVAVLAVALLSGCGGNGNASEAKGAGYTASSTGAIAASHERFNGAYDFCIQQVTERLKAPATAKFSERNRDNEAQDSGLYLFTGTVDSENGFGALIRSDWACKIRWKNGSYFAESVTIS